MTMPSQPRGAATPSVDDDAAVGVLVDADIEMIKESARR
jgi:hypothetical protein